MEKIEGIRFKSLAEAAAEQLRKAIIEGRLKPGERLVEQKMAAALGTSQPTLREALNELENQGFVRKIANKGTYVTELSSEDFRQILEVRLELEGLAIERAAQNMNPEGARDLERQVEEMDTAARELDRSRFHKADMAFHRLMWNLAGNEYLQAALERIVFSLFAFVLLKQKGPEFLAAAQQHREILDGLCSGDPAQAREVFLRSTLKFWKEHHQISGSTTKFLKNLLYL